MSLIGVVPEYKTHLYILIFVLYIYNVFCNIHNMRIAVPEATISVKVIKDEVEKSKNSKKIQHLSRSNNNNNNRKRIDVKTIKQEFECDPFFISKYAA